MNIRSTAVWALALLAGAAPASAQDSRTSPVALEVSRAVTGYDALTIFDDVAVRSDSGELVLIGCVTAAAKRRDLESRVSSVAGQARVRNEIRVLPSSAADDELRYRVARAIYGHPSFWTYATRAHPPIHILVEHGHVTLTGVVNSEGDRALARSLAIGLGEASLTSTLRTSAESSGR